MTPPPRSRLSSRVAIADVDDAEAFVLAAMKRTGLTLAPAEIEELLAEGLLILVKLHDTFEPIREGYDQPGRFSGYAAKFLPRKLLDAWHRLHPEHVRSKDGWRYLDPPTHLAVVQDEGDEDHERLVARRQRPTDAALHSTDSLDPLLGAWS